MVTQTLSDIYIVCFIPLTLLGTAGVVLFIFLNMFFGGKKNYEYNRSYAKAGLGGALLRFHMILRTRLSDTVFGVKEWETRVGMFMFLLLIGGVFLRLFCFNAAGSRYSIGLIFGFLYFFFYFLRVCLCCWQSPWRRPVLTVIISAVLIGGFCKEIRMSPRSRSDEEMVRFFAAQNPKSVVAVLSTDSRMERIVRSAVKMKNFHAYILPDDQLMWNHAVQRICSYYDNILVVSDVKDEQQRKWTETLRHLKNKKRVFSGKKVNIYEYHNAERLPLNVKSLPNTVINEQFNDIVSHKSSFHLACLRKKGVGFAKNVECFFPVGWFPNSAHYFSGKNLATIDMRIVADGINGASLYYSGYSTGSFASNGRFALPNNYIGSVAVCGGSNVEIAFYCYFYKNGEFLETRKLHHYFINGGPQVQLAFFAVDSIPPGATHFAPAFVLCGRGIMLDDIYMEKCTSSGKVLNNAK